MLIFSSLFFLHADVHLHVVMSTFRCILNVSLSTVQCPNEVHVEVCLSLALCVWTTHVKTSPNTHGMCSPFLSLHLSRPTSLLPLVLLSLFTLSLSLISSSRWWHEVAPDSAEHPIASLMLSRCSLRATLQFKARRPYCDFCSCHPTWFLHNTRNPCPNAFSCDQKKIFCSCM